MQKKGFTLIELLVVIAIIGLLGTLSVVSFSTSREKARISKGSGFEGSILRGVGDDLVARWDFDECSGSTFADTSGNNHVGTLVSGVTFSANTPTEKGCSLAFDGSNQINISSNPVGSLHTKTLWFYLIGDPNGNQYFIDLGNANNNWIRVLSGYVNGGVSPSYYAAGKTKIVTGKWYFLATAVDGNSSKIYLDGSLDNSIAAVAQAPSTITYLGGRGDGSVALRLNGLMDNIRIYNRALTSKEINQLYAEGLPQHLASE